MIKEFLVGESYSWADKGLRPFTVLKRTEKCMKVSDGTKTWRMKIHFNPYDKTEWVKYSSADGSRNSPYVSRPDWMVKRDYPESTGFRAIRTKVNENLTMLTLMEAETFEFYLKDRSHAFQYMFGLLKEKHTVYEAIDIAIQNIPDYVTMFED